MAVAYAAGAVATASKQTPDTNPDAELVRQLQNATQALGAQAPVIAAAQAFAKDDSYENLQVLVKAIGALQ